MTAEDTSLVPSRSSSALSLCSQSTDYTQYFVDDDISHAITAVPVDEDGHVVDVSLDASMSLTPDDLENVRPKRKRSDEDNEERPKKSLRTSQDSDKTVVGVHAASPVKRADTESTVSPSNPSTQPRPILQALSNASLPPPTKPPAKPVSIVPDVTAHSHYSTKPSVSFSLDETSAPVTSNFCPPEPVVVIRPPHLTSWLAQLPWGAQWEIARYVNTGFSFDNFTLSYLISLRDLGKNATAAPAVTRRVELNAPRTAPVDKPSVGKSETEGSDEPDEFTAAYAREHLARDPWEELDREEEALSRNPYAGIGCHQSGVISGSDMDWYGGKVHFTAKLVISDKTKGDFKLLLDRPQLDTSNRFMRRFGSRRFIRVRIQKDALYQKGASLLEYFLRPLVIGSAVFRAFFAKEQNVFFVKTNEEVQGYDGNIRLIAPSGPTANGDMAFMEFIKWHNDLNINKDQTMAKWAARFALGLSNSVPGIRLKPTNVKFEDDIVCDSFKGPGKPPSEMQMTDGCGFANRAAMQLLYDRFKTWERVPTAIQCRIGGAKGLLLVRHDLPACDENEPKECIMPTDTDPSKLTLDLLRASRLRCPARLSTETITNFAENGVPFKRFQKLFKLNLSERLDALLGWSSPDRPKGEETMKLLFHALSREGGVMAARLAREDGGTARVAGHVADDKDDELDDEDGLDQLDEALREQSSAWWEDPVSGCPSSLEETCMVLLSAGFEPKSCYVLRAKLAEVAKKVVKTFRTRYQFAVPMSCSAFIVPDPFGVLKAGEIQVKSSRCNLPDAQDRLTDYVLGDVLVTRHPCKVPSDVQKVRAVMHERLSHYNDVIVVSTASHTYKGESLERHLASLTGGGDYDGDTMEVFWDPEMVQAFNIPDPREFGVEPKSVGECLLKNTQSVAEYLAAVPSESPVDFQICSLQKYLLATLKDKSLVGQYSSWWENSTYHNGYGHKDTVFLAYMFCAILDGSKTGVTVKPDIYAKHQKNNIWQARAPNWKEPSKLLAKNTRDMDNRLPLKRPKSLDKFVMDLLRDVMDFECASEEGNIEKNVCAGLYSSPIPLDPHLTAPYLNARSRATELAEKGVKWMEQELNFIEAHVKAVAAKERVEMDKARKEKGLRSFTELPIERRQDVLRKLSREFHALPQKLLCFDKDEAKRVMASFAYKHDHETTSGKWTRFPWNVAMRQLCEIKAKALGSSSTLSNSFYHYMAIHTAYLRKYSDKI